MHAIEIDGVTLETTDVFFAYWYFAAERQKVFFNRLSNRGEKPTADEILLKYKFTNAYRASDRVSQYLIRNVIYRDDLSQAPDELFFRVLLFKLFNKIETWEFLEAELDEVSLQTYSFKRLDKLLGERMNRGERIYSAAYIIPSCGNVFGYEYKHQNHLKLIEWMLKKEIPALLKAAHSMAESYKILRSVPSLGPFLAYQFATDLNYSDLTNFPEDQFVVAGPGAIDGIQKCFVDTYGVSAEDIIKYMCEHQSQYLRAQNEPFQSLWGRQLQLIDCQNLFCEISKYARVAYPEVIGVSGRKRIKQTFVPSQSLPTPWYPPKWGLNEKISKDGFAHLPSFAGPETAADKQYTLF